ncbi:MAG TPA: hypothetical protein DD435_02685 [Cyanobacteria bacterium UBA8530]|nr:hypothetical protein [Cyanobacteria bacterium UBA8530]
MENLFRIILAIAWASLARTAFQHWQKTGSFISFGILFINSLIVCLFLLRRESISTSQQPLDWVIGGIGTFLPLLMRPVALPSPLATLAVPLQLLGALLILACVLSLGKSFGIVAANRGIKVDWAYRLVRHPLYASELFFFGAYTLGNPSPWNGGLFALLCLVQFLRARAEEKLLLEDESYRSYFKAVPFRFIPGLI